MAYFLKKTNNKKLYLGLAVALATWYNMMIWHLIISSLMRRGDGNNDDHG